MMGTNWIDEKTLLLKSKASIEKGKKPKGLRIVVLNVPKKVALKIAFRIDKYSPKPYKLGRECDFDKELNAQFILRTKKISLIHGRLYSNGKEIYDFAKDTFEYVSPPNNYFS